MIEVIANLVGRVAWKSARFDVIPQKLYMHVLVGPRY
eukprot:SAG31_NODE_203_length_20490_cov_7.713256_11_plen_37_part_00